MGEVVPARTSPTLHPPSPPTVHQLSRLARYELSIDIYIYDPVRRNPGHRNNPGYLKILL